MSNIWGEKTRSLKYERRTNHIPRNFLKLSHDVDTATKLLSSLRPCLRYPHITVAGPLVTDSCHLSAQTFPVSLAGRPDCHLCGMGVDVLGVASLKTRVEIEGSEG
jgi:hypothetical protein